MDELTIICPICKNIRLLKENCPQCDYNIRNDQLLIDRMGEKYNYVIDLLSQNRVMKAWKEINESLNIYPFIVEFLDLSFNLATINGAYNDAHAILKQLKPIISEEDYNYKKEIITFNISIYNDIVKNKINNDNYKKYDLSHYHLLVLLKSANTETRLNIIKEIDSIDAEFSDTIIIKGNIFREINYFTILFFLWFLWVLYYNINN